MMKKIFLTTICVLLCALATVSVVADAGTAELAQGIIAQRTQSLSAEKILAASGAGEADWFAIGMSRLGTDDDFADYADKTKSSISERYAELGGLDRSRSTEWAKAILVLLACGESPSDVGGINLLNDGIYYRENLGRQGLNAYCWALIALNASGESSPMDALNSADTIIGEILAKQLSDGGFNLMGTTADTDLTALVLTALSPYTEREDVRAATERAITALSALQNDDGGFSGMGTPNCESTAQALTALCSTGIDIHTDKRFIKNNFTVLDGLLKFRLENGGFCHITDKPTANPVASEQALYALAALKRFDEGESALFDFGGAVTQGTDSDTSNTQSDNGDNPPQGADSAASQGGNSSPNGSENEADENPSNTSSLNGDTESKSNSAEKENSFGVQQIIAAVFFAAAVVFIGLWLWKRRKDFLTIGIICAIVGVLLCLFKISGTDEFYGSVENSASGTVTLSISCTKAVERGLPERLSEYIPSDGIILAEAEIGFNDGDSAFDTLLRAVRGGEIQLEYSGEGASAYIRGISNLYEYDMGELSGWMYRVNGEYPPGSCGSFSLSEGDRVEFVYTLDLGRDVGDKYGKENR